VLQRRTFHVPAGNTVSSEAGGIIRGVTPTIEYVAAYATAATAGGTFLLALATFRLAGKTRELAKSGEATATAAKQELNLLGDQAESTRRQSEAAEAALNASVRPLLLDVPRHTYRPVVEGYRRQLEQVDVSAIIAVADRDEVSLTVPIRNAGAGIALVVAVAITVARDGAIGEPVVPGEPPSAVVAREEAAVFFEETGGSDQRVALEHLLTCGEDLVIEVAYTDIAGRQEAATLLYVTQTGQAAQKLRVRRVVPAQPRRWTLVSVA
jgi:hypothetical protein